MSRINDASLADIDNYVSGLVDNYPKNVNTRVEYAKIFNRITNDYDYDLVQYSIDNPLSKSAFYKYKASLQYGLAFSIKAYIKEYQESSSEADYEQVLYLFDVLKGYDPKIGTKLDVESWKNQKSLYPADQIRIKKGVQKESEEKPLRQKRTSKRNSIKGQSPGWQWLVCQQVCKGYRLPSLVLALTGCRPAEVGNGIELFMEDGLLMCQIKGVKFSDTKGHETRTIGFDPADSSVAGFLADAIKKSKTGNHIIELPDGNSANSVRRFGDKVRYAAQRKLGFKEISAYSFRHQVASDLRKEGFSAMDLAMMLGHRTTRMRKHYGLKTYGNSGGNGIRHLDASQKDLIKRTFHEQPPVHLQKSDQNNSKSPE